MTTPETDTVCLGQGRPGASPYGSTQRNGSLPRLWPATTPGPGVFQTLRSHFGVLPNDSQLSFPNVNMIKSP